MITIVFRSVLIRRHRRQSPWFGEPSYYRRTNVVTMTEEKLNPPLQMSALGVKPGEQLLIHPSRVIRFLGLDYPDVERAQDSWGDNVLQPIYDAIRGFRLGV